MPFDANGKYNLPAGYRAVDGETIESSQHNPPLEDIASALSNTILKDGRSVTTADLKLGGHKITGMADGTASTDAATVGQAAAAVGDFKDSVRNLGTGWLRRDGALYLIDDYPDLAAVLPPLADGVNWTTLSPAFTTFTISDMTKTTTGYAAIAYDASGTSTTYVFTSADGLGWSLQGTITGLRGACIAQGAGIYVICDGFGKASVSNDLITWTAPAYAMGTGAEGITSIVFAFSVFVIVGTNGKILTSANGTAWTAQTSGTTQLLQCVKLLNGILVAVGLAGTIRTSTNATTWTGTTAGSTSFSSVTYGNGLYVVVGQSGVVYTSPNLTAWTLRTSTTSQNLNDVNYSSAGFIAVGIGGTAIISGVTSGTTWATVATGTAQNLNTVVIDPAAAQKYIVGGSSGITLRGVRTLPTQFQVPDDDATYGWIRAA